MNILEELWYGNICPHEHPLPKDSAYAAALHRVSGEKEKLQRELPPEMEKELEKLLDAQMEAAVIAEREAFLLGFRLATQLMVAGLTGVGG